MSNLRIFGSPIHDTALVFIVGTTLASIFFYYGDQEITRSEANLTLLNGALLAIPYWYTQYKVKK